MAQRKKTAKSVKQLLSTPTHEDIARRAFEIYVESGQIHGRHEEHWLRAEKELRS